MQLYIIRLLVAAAACFLPPPIYPSSSLCFCFFFFFRYFFFLTSLPFRLLDQILIPILNASNLYDLSYEIAAAARCLLAS
jgi:hypothetical protein